MTKRILLLLIFSLCLIAAKAAEPTILNISNIDLGDDPFRDYQFTSPSLSFSFIIVHPKQTYSSKFNTSDNAYKLYKIDKITANASLMYSDLRQEDEISRDIKLFDYDPFKSSDSDYVHLFRESVTEEFGISLKYVQIDLNNGNISSLDIDQGISYYSKPVRTDNRWYIAYMKGRELIIKFISISDTHEVQLRETFRAYLFHFDLKDLIVIKNSFDLDYIYVRSGTKIYLVAGPDSLELVSDFGIGTYNFIFDESSDKLLYLNGGSVVKSAYVDDQSSARNLYSKRFLSQKFKGTQFYSDFTINQMSINGLKITLAIHKDSNPQPTTYIILRPFLPPTQKNILFKEPQRGYKETGFDNGKIIYLTNKGTINSINRQSGKESKIGKINCDGVLLNDTDYVVNFVLKTESEVDCSDIKLNITDKNMPIKFFQLN